MTGLPQERFAILSCLRPILDALALCNHRAACDKGLAGNVLSEIFLRVSSFFCKTLSEGGDLCRGNEGNKCLASFPLWFTLACAHRGLLPHYAVNVKVKLGFTHQLVSAWWLVACLIYLMTENEFGCFATDENKHRAKRVLRLIENTAIKLIN